MCEKPREGHGKEEDCNVERAVLFEKTKRCALQLEYGEVGDDMPRVA